ncbi:MAG TPA: serine hydrolase domain-containing protein [Chitinophagales bacterium]|jgi:CubicO group peptidase (beta-lactamase class C family)|nr:serine hydrolase domain-containing protein [Chitinophagales bacterium]
MSVPISGYVKEGFEKVKTTFEENFAKRKEVGASCCVYYKGEKVVDLWGGYRDKAKKQYWEEDTISIVFSSTKGISSMAFALLHSKGLVDYDEKVSTYWPAFAHNGKENITIRQLLAHQAGLFTNDKKLKYEVLTDEDVLADCLAKQKPYWNPGDKKGYHAWTIAMYQNEICKRVDPLKKSLHRFFKDEIADALNIDFHIGLPKEIPQHRIAQLIPFLPQEAFTGKQNTDLGRIMKGILNPFSHFYKSLLNPPHALNLNNFNNRKYVEIPNGSAHGFGNARSIAQTYNEFATGGKNLHIRQETLTALEAAPIHPKHGKNDLVLNVDIPFSLGFAKPSEFQNFGVNYRSYGSFGAGGSGGFADPEKQVAFGYVMNKMGTHIANDPREFALRTATYESILNLEMNQKIKKEEISAV